MDSAERPVPEVPYEGALKRLRKAVPTPLTKEDLYLLGGNYELLDDDEIGALFEALEARFELPMSDDERQAEDLIYSRMLKHWLLSRRL